MHSKIAMRFGLLYAAALASGCSVRGLDDLSRGGNGGQHDADVPSDATQSDAGHADAGLQDAASADADSGATPPRDASSLSDAQTGGGTPDAGSLGSDPPKANPFCESQPADGHCETFEAGAASDLFSGSDVTQARGELGFTTGGKEPSSTRCLQSRLTSGPGSARAEFNGDVPLRKLDAAFDVNLGGVNVGAGQSVVWATLQHDLTSDTGVHPGVSLVRRGATDVVTFSNFPSSRELPLPLLAAGWHRVAISVTFGSAGRVRVSYDQTVVLDESNLGLVAANVKWTYTLLGLSADGALAQSVALYDDLETHQTP